MESTAWFSFAVIPIGNNSEDYRKPWYYQIESFEHSRELSLSFVWEQAFYRRLDPGNGPSESVPFADHFVRGSRAVLQLLSDRR